MKKHTYHLLTVLFVFSCLICTGCSTPAKNVILMIGDGMGPEQVLAASIYKTGKDNCLFMETLPVKGQVTTYSASNKITDSAAAATALATGIKVNNGVISTSIPGTGQELTTALEIFKATGKSTGLVTTSYIIDATPAGFGAHEKSRYNRNEIANDYLTQTRPNVLFGAGQHGISPEKTKHAKYTTVETLSGLNTINTETQTFTAGLFGVKNYKFSKDKFSGVKNIEKEIPYEAHWTDPDCPHLSQMTAKALDILDNDPDGFFLMVEGGKIDWAGHANNIENNIGETLEFDRTIELVTNWAKKHPHTLIIITADHECGGLKVIENNGKGNLPKVVFSSKGHTAANVPLYVKGPKAKIFRGTIDNTDIFRNILAAAKITTEKQTASAAK